MRTNHRFGGVRRQHGVAQGRGGQAGRMKGNADAGAQHSFQNGWTAHDAPFAGLEIELGQVSCGVRA